MIKQFLTNIFLVTFFGRGIQFFLMFAAIKISTTLLPPDEYGKYGVAMAFIAFISYIFIGPAGLTINRNINNWKNDGRLINIFNGYFLYLFFISLLSAAIGYFYLYENTLSFSVQFYSLFLYLLFFTISYTIIPAFNILGMNTWFYFLLNINIGFGIVISAVLISTYGESHWYWILGIAFSNFFTAIAGYFVILKRYPSKNIKYKTDYFKNLKFSVGILLASIFTWGYLMGYRFIAESSVGYASLGKYLAESTIALGVISAYEQITAGLLLPKFYSAADKSERAWGVYAEKMIATSIPVCFFILGTGDLIGKVVLGDQFQNEFIFLKICAVTETIRVLIGVLGFKFHQNYKTFNMVIPNFFLAVLTNLLIFYFIERMGIIIVPISMLVIGLGVSVIYLFVIGKEAFKIFRPIMRYFIISSAVFSLIFFIFDNIEDGKSSIVLKFILYSVSMGCVYLSILNGNITSFFKRK